MAMELGGRADKLGNEYERLWVVYQLLHLLADEVTSVTWEPPKRDAEGIDVLVEFPDGTRSHQSCKRENAGHGKWTLAHLNGRGVLDAAKTHLSVDAGHRFAFVTRDICSELRDLAERALPYKDASEDYYEKLSGPLRSSFRQLTQYWGFDAESADDRRAVHAMLRRCIVYSGFDLDLLRDNVRRRTQHLMEGDPDIVRTLLADYAVAEDRLGTRVDRDSLEKFLGAKSISLRMRDDVASVRTAIDALQVSFIDSIQPYLIGEQLIHREDATRLIDVVTSKEVARPRLVMVHGRKGIGKSGVLFELVVALQERGVPFLPVRLDRKVPIGSAAHFGREVCGLPASPIRALESIAGNKRAVLILDQLDALRWTAAHTDRPMDILTEIVREALNPLARADISVVVVCRSFDLEDDPRIAHLKSLAQSASIEIGLLTPEATRDIVDSGRDVWASLSDAQQHLLQQPQALYLWTRLKALGRDVPVFRTHTDLMRAFWQDLFEEKRPQNVDTHHLRQVLDRFVAHMDETGRLTASASLIDLSKGHIVRFLQSSGVIWIDDRNQCVFTHQSYFDFLVADELNRRLLAGEADLRDWLRASGQSLFRRDQLRQVLALQRDDDSDAYIGAVEELLRDGEIRFHLKQLVIRLLGQAAPATPGEVDLIVRLLGEEEWREHIFGSVLWNKPSWFAALDEQALWTSWLDSEDETLIDMALRMVGFMSRHFGDRIAAMLSDYVDADDPWPDRVAKALACGAVKEESNAVFDLRLALSRRGQRPFGHVWWERLAKSHPKRCVQLFDLHLRLFVQAGNALKDGRSEELVSTGIESHGRDEALWLRKPAARYPCLVWSRIAPTCVSMERVRRWSQRRHDRTDLRSPIYQVFDQSQDLLKLSEQLVVAAGRSLARRRPDVFKGLVRHWETRRRTRLVERSLLRSMEALPENEADYVLNWLIAKPRRLRIGDSIEDSTEHEPARRLITRFAPHCSHAVMSRLEDAVFNYRDPDLRRMMEYDHQRAMEGHYYPNHHGRAQYVLSSAIPSQRLTGRRREQLAVWQRKFGQPPSGRRSRPEGGWVGSTVPAERLHFITDEQWLRITQGDWSRKRHRHKVMGPNRFGEASHEHFANDMEAMARRQPGRFARLATRLPDATPPVYLQRVLRAFEQKDPPDVLTKAKEQNKGTPDRIHSFEQELAEWRSATQGQIESVLAKVGFPNDGETARAICSLIETRDDVDWSETTVGLIARIATEHADPEDNALHVRSNAGPRGAMKPDVSSSGINCARGAAAMAIEDLLFRNPSLYEVLKPAVSSLTTDTNVGVRAAAIATCVPILNIDGAEAVSHFVALCATDDDRVFESHYLDWFLTYALWRHPEQLVPIVQRMVRSPIEKVAKRGAAWVTAAWLHKGWCDELLEVCRTGSQPQRHGVAEVAGQSPWEREAADGRLKLLPALFDDDDKDVRHDAAGVFWKDEPWQEDRLIDLALQFIDSRTFANYPTPIIHGLNEIRGSLLKHGAVIHAIADQFAGPLAEVAKDLSDGVGADVADLFKLLLRLYQQAQDSRQHDVQVACLDRWDSLLRAGVGGYRDAESMLDSIDR